MIYVTRLRLSIIDPIVQKALKLIDKGISLNHILAEVLLYTYLKNEGFEYITIEETIGNAKCDVYAKNGLDSMCIEIETYVVPTEYVLEGYHYLIARHVKKLIQISKEGIKGVSFAYPLGVIPSIPLVLLKHPKDRSREELEQLASITKKFYSLDLDYMDQLENCVLSRIYVYDIAMQRVFHLSEDSVIKLISFYTNILELK